MHDGSTARMTVRENVVSPGALLSARHFEENAFHAIFSFEGYILASLLYSDALFDNRGNYAAETCSCSIKGQLNFFPPPPPRPISFPCHAMLSLCVWLWHFVTSSAGGKGQFEGEGREDRGERRSIT